MATLATLATKKDLEFLQHLVEERTIEQLEKIQEQMLILEGVKSPVVEKAIKIKRGGK